MRIYTTLGIKYLQFIFIMMLIGLGILIYVLSGELLYFGKTKEGTIEHMQLINDEFKLKLKDDSIIYRIEPHHTPLLNYCDTSIIRKGAFVEVSYIKSSLIKSVKLGDVYAIRKSAFYIDRMQMLGPLMFLWLVIFFFLKRLRKYY